VSDSSGSIYLDSMLVVSFDATQTPLSNGNGETLDAAAARIAGILEGQGFQKQSQKTRGSKFPLRLLAN
jgi:outer membrane lipoprotein SlyB